jgi:hypothetical protein
LEAPEPPFAVLFVYGPGGIGKTSLLDVFGQLAAGATLLRLDGRDLSPSPHALLAALRSAASVPEEDAPIVSPRRLVLLLDSYERLGPVDGWLRSALLPRLPPRFADGARRTRRAIRVLVGGSGLAGAAAGGVAAQSRPRREP